MRRVIVLTVALVAAASLARAQSPTPPARGYVEAVAQSAFGNVTSQSFGGEFGLTVRPGWQVFVDVGQVRNVATSDLGAKAQKMATFLTDTQGSAAYRVREPVAFGVAGARYLFPVTSPLEPYVLVGAGVARVRRDITFAVGGNDVTGTLPQYGVTLGSDLSGSDTKAMMTLGGGVAWPVWARVVVDFQYRYGRVFASGQGLNVNRAGIGIGVRF